MLGSPLAPRGWPRPELAFPWGSRSTSRTRFSATASEAARFTAVVVLPTPPFWFAIARTDPMPPLRSDRDHRSPNARDVPRGIDDAQIRCAFHVEQRDFRSSNPLVNREATFCLRDRKPVGQLLLQDQILGRCRERLGRPEHAEDETAGEHVMLGQ